MSTAIEWTEETWNPVTGCTKVSPGCDHCYAERITNRFRGPGAFDIVKLHSDRLAQPLRRRKPTMWFVNSMSDLFHDDVPDQFIVETWAVMSACPDSTFQVLTKRPGRMRSLLSSDGFWRAVVSAVNASPVRLERCRNLFSLRPDFPLPNVWLGTSVEDQKWADVRIPVLGDVPAAVRFLSIEPLLGPIDLAEAYPAFDYFGSMDGPTLERHGIHWIIVGGESGPGARAVDPAWVRSLRDQCVADYVPFFFKQWGGKTPKAGGRELDGRTWDEMPERRVVNA